MLQRYVYIVVFAFIISIIIIIMCTYMEVEYILLCDINFHCLDLLIVHVHVRVYIILWPLIIV